MFEYILAVAAVLILVVLVWCIFKEAGNNNEW